ncbi:glucose-1-phosphate adenylyltransferase [Bacillus ectoiniformans]|uniref:sugar phosphate nucleotidyltransferase n=1 Tax=Bacillus ectoiniformans TaxID=1494429 RepID=UPI001956EBF4|nr:sugar phosphate nucleotidyltransferase [Bacillus ectoiniformans]MBM7649735.1 glucose-1-phosphate adenylyltransferase [Bacillus ectoiniformans]
MNKSMLGVIDATTHPEAMGDLLNHRSLAALPFAGRYRLIDFILSNMVNSGIQSVAIFPKSQYRSLMDHLGSGKNWDLDRKRDGLFFFPSPNVDHEEEEIGAFSHFAHHLDYFYRSKQTYALISNCYTVFNMDFSPILERLESHECDILEICNQGKPVDMYVVPVSLLIDFVTNRKETGYTSMRDIVNDDSHMYNVCRYECSGYCEQIQSTTDLYRTSMELLKKENWSQLFNKFQPVYTKVKDEPPTKYTNRSAVRNSMIANGARIEGEITDSIISRAVRVGENTEIKRSIIMQKSQVGRNCLLEHVIIDKDVIIGDGVTLRGTPDEPIVIRKGSIQGALMNS